MDHRALNRPSLIDFARNSAAGLAAGKVPGFLPAQAEMFADLLIALADELEGNQSDAIAKRSAAQGATSLAQQNASRLTKVLSQLKFGMRSVGAASDQFYALGFNAPDNVHHRIRAEMPTALDATGFSYGVNKLSWTRNNPNGSVMFVIEYKTSRQGPYSYLATVTSRKYEHKNVTPGQFYQYRVKAVTLGGDESDWSNEAVVYGSQPEPEQNADRTRPAISLTA
jgi:hypothetical protein